MISSAITLYRGDIVITVFPYTDLTGSKRRPALVLGGDAIGGDVILGFISSVVPRSLTKHDLLLTPSHSEFAATGLKAPSVLKLDKIATIARRLVTRRIGRLGSSWQSQADQLLITTLHIDIKPNIIAEYSRLAAILEASGVEALINAVQS